MKRAGFIILSLFIFSLFINAQSVVSSLHNLSVSSPGTIKASSESEVCIFCHTPHNSNPMGPLWNRDDPGSVYVLYDNSVSNTFLASSGQPDGASLLCLSCHDGTTALGKIRSKTTNIAFVGNNDLISGNKNFSTDLSDDHPVSFIYNSSLAAADGQLKYPPLAPSKVDNTGKLQCTSCHEPHNNTYKKFLLATTSYSSLCFNCHDKNYWTTSTHQSSSATWNGSGTNPWAHINRPYPTVAENACASCHDTHNANGKARLLKSNFEENTCLDCHNGNVANTDIEAEMNKAYRHNVFAYNQIHTPIEDADPQVTHVECVDCHNPHAVNNSTASAPNANGSLAGVRGINQSGNPVNVVQNEYELCYRCHSDNPVVGSPTTRQIAQANVRLEFDLSNPSFHPIGGAGKNNNVPSLIAPLNESSVIYCTDCHASNGNSSPAGPHGSIYPNILKYRYETADYTAESYANYELCYSCHSRSSILNDESFTEHRKHIRGEDAPCNVCHDPHGISSSQGNTTNNSHLINFDVSVVQPRSGVIRFVKTGTNRGYCLLRCHGKNHGMGMRYP